MLKNLFLSFVFTTSAFSAPLPQVFVNGVPHKVILGGILEYGRYRDAPESGKGFCVRNGLRDYSGAVSVRSLAGPYALLNAQGAVAKTFDDVPENQRRFWIAERIDCI